MVRDDGRIKLSLEAFRSRPRRKVFLLWRERVILLLIAFTVLLNAFGDRGPVVIGPILQNTSCKFPIREDWTPLCLTVEAVQRERYEEGERVDVRLTIRNDGDKYVERRDRLSSGLGFQ